MRAASRDRGIGSIQQGCATHPAPRKGVSRSALLQHKCEEDIRMKLYERDFSEAITQTEKDALREEISFEERKGLKHLSDAPRFAHPDPDVRVFLWRNRSMFPNNYLDPVSIRNENLEELSENYVAALDAASNERDIQHYIRKDKKWYIPGALCKEYNFGHHSAYLFPEQALGTKYATDYMLLGENSDGYSIVLVEFEDVNCTYLNSTSNSETSSVRKGITQINDWKRWMDQYHEYFLQSIELTYKRIFIPTTRIYYVLVVGRRKMMTAMARDVRSQTMFQTSNLKVITYDRLADDILQLSSGY